MAVSAQQSTGGSYAYNSRSEHWPLCPEANAIFPPGHEVMRNACLGKYKDQRPDAWYATALLLGNSALILMVATSRFRLEPLNKRGRS